MQLAGEWTPPGRPRHVTRPYEELARHPLLSGTSAPLPVPGSLGSKCAGAKCSLLVVVPGIGGKHLSALLDIFAGNRRAVEARAAGVFHTIDWRVYSYSEQQHAVVEAALAATTSSQGSIAGSVRVIRHPGMVGDHLRAVRNAAAYSFVFTVLDDAELTVPVDWPHLVALQEAHTLDAIGACAVNNSASPTFSFMGCQGLARHDAVVTLFEVHVQEFFAIVFTGFGFQHYQSYVSPSNPTLWGPEGFMSLGMGLRHGIVQGSTTFSFLHRFPLKVSGGYTTDQAIANRQVYVQQIGTSIDARRIIFQYNSMRATHYIRSSATPA